MGQGCRGGVNPAGGRSMRVHREAPCWRATYRTSLKGTSVLPERGRGAVSGPGRRRDVAPRRVPDNAEGRHPEVPALEGPRLADDGYQQPLSVFFTGTDAPVSSVNVTTMSRLPSLQPWLERNPTFFLPTLPTFLSMCDGTLTMAMSRPSTWRRSSGTENTSAVTSPAFLTNFASIARLMSAMQDGGVPFSHSGMCWLPPLYSVRLSWQGAASASGCPAVPASALIVPPPTLAFDEHTLSLEAAFIFAAVHVALTAFVLTAPPSNPIEYVSIGEGSVPSSRVVLKPKLSPPGLGFFFVPPLTVTEPDTSYLLVAVDWAIATAAIRSIAIPVATK